MESRASYLLVGIFVLGLLAVATAFVFWVARFELHEARTYYYIYFRGSVTGLSEGSAVRLRGVPVGSVTAIAIDTGNIELIEVTIAVKPGTPIKTNTVASLQLQGITGLSFVQLAGGTQNAPNLEPRPGKRRAVIPSTPSPFEKLFESAPELMTNVTVVAERAAALLSEENMAKVSAILGNVQVATGEAAARTEEIGALIADLRRAVADASGMILAAEELMKDGRGTLARLEREATSTLGEIRQAMRDADRLMVDARPAIGDLRATAQNFAKMAEQLEGLVREARPPVRDFADQGLYEVTAFFAEARTLMAALQRLATALERDPARFLFGDQTKGFEPAR